MLFAVSFGLSSCSALPTIEAFDEVLDISPRFSPDGSSLVFASDRDGSKDLYEVDLATGEISQLTSAPGSEADPAYAPGGGIVFVYSPTGDAPWSLEYVQNGEQTELMSRLSSSSAFPDVSRDDVLGHRTAEALPTTALRCYRT
jgi:Tol biopolymer transport system component